MMPNWYKWSAERTARFRRLPVCTRLYLIEAMLYLLAARLALRAIHFRRLMWFFERAPRLPRDTFAERQRIGAVSRPPYPVHQNEIMESEREHLRRRARWLTREAAWFLLGETVCFPRSIAAQMLLRRLSIGTPLYYGTAILPERGLTAHVWLQDGDEIVIGRCHGQVYHVLAYYPKASEE